MCADGFKPSTQHATLASAVRKFEEAAVKLRMCFALYASTDFSVSAPFTQYLQVLDE
jgi:hypothetical protein